MQPQHHISDLDPNDVIIMKPVKRLRIAERIVDEQENFDMEYSRIKRYIIKVPINPINLHLDDYMAAKQFEYSSQMRLHTIPIPRRKIMECYCFMRTFLIP